jgi:hypothetical protein
MINIKELSKYILFGFVFLISFVFFFLGEMPTKLFVLIVVLIVFSLQLIDSFKIKEFLIKRGLTTKILALFIFVSFLSFLFSVNIKQSFVGGIEQINSLTFLFLLFLLFIFVANIFKEKEEIINIFYSMFSGLLIVSVLIIFGFKTIFPIESLAIIISLALGSSLYLIFLKQRKFQIVVFSILSFVFFCSLIVIGFKIAWFIVSFFSFFIFWKKSRESNFNFKERKVLISLLCFVVFFFLFISPNLIESSYNFDLPLSMEESIKISLSSISSFKGFILGSGIGTFNYNYALYNEGPLIPMTVCESASGFLTILSEIGAIGLLLLLVLFLYISFKGIVCFLKNNTDIEDVLFLNILSIFILLMVWKIEVILFVLVFIFWGLWESFTKEKINIPFNSLIVIFIVSLIMVFCFTRYFISDKLFTTAFDDYNNGNIDEAVLKMEKAAKVFGSSDYYIGLSQLYLLKATDVFNNNWSLDQNINEQKEENDKLMKTLASQAEVIAQKATSIDPYNFLTWQNLGLVYENTSFLIEDKSDKALESIDKAISLSSNNFLAHVVKGRIYEAKKQKEKALEEYKKVLEIYPSYEKINEKIEELNN